MKKSDIAPFGALPSQRQIEHFRYFSQKAFFHFGVNTFSNLEWGHGEESEKIFNPTSPDVRQWIKTVKAAGFTLAVLTVKHHDGFCLWPSKYTEHTIAASPYQNGEGDIVREFTDACHEFGVAVGIYISPWDRNSKYWGTDGYSTFFNNQLTELLTNYGRIDEVWWDGAGSADARYDWGLWAYTVRNLQPHAPIFGSMGAWEYVEFRWVGNEMGITADTHYSTIDPQYVKYEDTDMLATGNFGGERFMIGEVDVSIRPGWFYHADQDSFVRTPKQIVDIWFNSVGNSSAMLLNFPPDRRGLVHEIDRKNAIEANRILSSALSVNFAAGAQVTADSQRDGFNADNIVNGVYDTFYAPQAGCFNPTLDILLAEEATFDTLIIGEYIELGVRVKGFTVEAMVDGRYEVIADKKSIGFKKAVYFGKVTTDRLRIKIYDAGAEPLIRELGLYAFEDNGYNVNEIPNTPGKQIDIAHNPSAHMVYEEDGVLVQHGGLFPFNTVCFCGDGIDEYEILIFNGSNFYSAHKGLNPAHEEVVTFEETVNTAYQFKLKTNKKHGEEINIRVYYM